MRTAIVGGLSALLLAAAAVAAEPELVLAGGALGVCSSLSPQRCAEGVAPPDGRVATHHGLDAAAVERAVDPLLWPDRDARFVARLRQQLEAVAQRLGGGAVSADALIDALSMRCDRCGPPLWQRLDDRERATLLAALERPQQVGGERLREQVVLDGTASPHGPTVLRAFVDAAARRSGDARPVVAVVTASAFDPFEPVDFYLQALRQAGAEPYWWPIDAASAEAMFGDAARDCAALGRLRRSTLGLPGRATIYADLVDVQRRWCAQAAADRLPAGTHGVFFSGGDQWRLHHALFSAGQPNGWLQSLRAAFARGEVAVGGTSAGTAIQAGPYMLSNGSPVRALQHGPLAAPPPEPGCHRAGRCSDIDEQRLTWWPAGGTGLAAPFITDTHFSERTREWRLLRALAEPGAPDHAIGVDEGSAIVLRGRGLDARLEAIGASGGWLFEVLERGCGRMAGRAHYLAPGVGWRRDSRGVLQPERALPPPTGPAPPAIEDPLAAGAIRALAQRLALTEPGSETAVSVEGATLTLRRPAAARAWQAERSAIGIVGLEVALTFPAACTGSG